MAATRTDLIRQVLEDLTVIDAISNPEANDTAAVDRRADTITSLAKERGLCWWDEDSIPDYVMPFLVKLVANESAPAFGKPQIDTLSHPGWRGLASVKNTDEITPQRPDYF